MQEITLARVESSMRNERKDISALLEFAKVPNQTAAVAARFAGPDGGIGRASCLAGGPGFEPRPLGPEPRVLR